MVKQFEEKVKARRDREDGRRAPTTPAAAHEAPLVYPTKSVDTFKSVIDPQTGVVTRFEKKNRCDEYREIKEHESARFERYALQRLARSFLIDHKHPRGHSQSWRVTECLRRLNGTDVKVLKSIEHNRAHFGNLRVCGSVWTCPICAAKISEQRKNEISEALNVHHASNGVSYMVTLTFSHSRNDSLKELLGDSKRKNGLRAALQRLRDSRGYKNLTQKIGLIGVIRALEVTHGEQNGWHPHVHELWLLPDRLSTRAVQDFKNELFRLWHNACVKSNLAAPNRKRGVDIQYSFSPAEYLQKWGHEQNWGAGTELTKTHQKKGTKTVGRTPWDLLRLADENKTSKTYKSLFQEYATAFFGARQCFWTSGLKALFGITDKTDEQIALEEDDKAIVICSISKQRWQALLRLDYDARAVVLRLAETGGADAVDAFLQQLKN